MIEKKINLTPFGICLIKEKSFNANSSELVNLLANHFVVVIKNFAFNEIPDYIHFIEKLGKPFTGSMWCSHPQTKAIQIVTNKKIGEKKMPGLFSGAKLEWHTNGLFCDNPEQIVCLYCKTPGDSVTQFLDTTLALKHIRKSSDIDIDDIMVEISNSSTKTILKETVYDPLPKHEQLDISKHRYRDKGIENSNLINKNFTQIKSLIQKHPITGAEGLFFPKFNISKIFSKKTQKPLNKEFFKLCELIFREEFIYTHQWEKGDLILCDQILTLHKRSKQIGERELYRSALWYH